MNSINNLSAPKVIFLTRIFGLGLLCFFSFTGSAQTLETVSTAINWKSAVDATNTIQAIETAPKQQMPNIPVGAPSSENLVRRTLSCDVVFGSSLATCTGTGICQISARTNMSQTAYEQKQGCQGTVGLQSQIDGGKGVSLLLMQALLCPNFYKTHLRNGLLIQEIPCKLSKDVIEILGLKISELPIGEYPVKEENGYLKIDFQIPSGIK